MRISALLFTILFANTLMAQSKLPFVNVESGVSLVLAKERKNRLSKINYQIEFFIPEKASEPLEGKLNLRFELNDKKAPLQLDFKGPGTLVKNLAINGKKASVDLRQGHLILPVAGLKKGSNNVQISFTPSNQSLNRSPDYLYTLVVPDRACTVFPCFDQPDLKAQYSLSLDIPRQWEALHNSAWEKQDSSQAGRKVLSSGQSQVFSTYLFAFCAGRFQKIVQTRAGRSMTMLYRETDQAKVQRNASAIFDLHAQALQWLESYTGIPLPFPKLDFALMPGFQYGGMEHVGSIFYRESSLMLDESATDNQKLARASLIAHETAHMWFGDLVTMRWFDDVWLKEVFANFMAAKIVNPSFPQINHDLRFLLAHHPTAYAEDRSLGSHPIQQSLDNLQEAGSLYGGIIYQKAPIVMRQLEETIGEQAFQKGIREYLQKFAYNNANWDELIAILDAQTPLDLTNWSKSWVKAKGLPVFNVQQELTDNKPSKVILKAEGEVKNQKCQLALFYPDEVKMQSFEIKAQATEIDLSKVPSPLAVLPGADPASYGYFDLPPVWLSYFLDNTTKVKDPVLRGAVRLNLYEAVVREKIAPLRLLESHLQAIPLETESLNRQLLLSQLETLYWRFLIPDQRKIYTALIEEILWDAMEKSAEASAKSAYFQAYQSLAGTWAGVTRLEKVWTRTWNITGLPLSENQRTDLACTLALRWPDRAESILKQQATQISNPDRQQRFAFIRPALSSQTAVRDSFFSSLKNVANRKYEPWVEEALGYLCHPLRAQSSEKYIRSGLELMEEIQKTGDIFFPRRFATSLLSGQQSQSSANQVLDFLSNNSKFPERLRNKVLMSADLLFRASQQISDPLPKPKISSQSELKAAIEREFSRQKGTFFLAFRDLKKPQTAIFINEKTTLHPASTMKTPVMLEVYKQASAGKFKLSDSIRLHNQFKSIVDGSPYSLTEDDDSEFGLYARLGSKASIDEVVYAMITRSSNLATNLLIELVDPKQINQSLNQLGIKDLVVMRGVEDDKAFAKGLNNRTNAFDLLLLFEKLGQKTALDPISCEKMLQVLREQHFNDAIPAQLPASVAVAHKTGWITRHRHDSGLVELPDGRKYGLVILSKDWESDEQTRRTMARVSEWIYEWFVAYGK
jgi:aminopeptidase N